MPGRFYQRHQVPLSCSNQDSVISFSLLLHVQSCAHLCPDRPPGEVHEGFLVSVQQILQCQVWKSREVGREGFLSDGDSRTISPLHRSALFFQRISVGKMNQLKNFKENMPTTICQAIVVFQQCSECAAME